MTFQKKDTVAKAWEIAALLRESGDSVVMGNMFVTAVGVGKEESGCFLLYCRNTDTDEYLRDLRFAGVLVTSKGEGSKGRVFKRTIYVAKGSENWLGDPTLPHLDATLVTIKANITKEIKKLYDQLPTEELDACDMALAKRTARNMLTGNKEKELVFNIGDEEALDVLIGEKTVEKVAQDNINKYLSYYKWKKAIDSKAQELVKDVTEESAAWEWCLDVINVVKTPTVIIEFKLNRHKCKAPFSKREFLSLLAQGSNVAIKAENFPTLDVGLNVMKRLYGSTLTPDSALMLENIESISENLK